jgi:hypothetical protein
MHSELRSPPPQLELTLQKSPPAHATAATCFARLQFGQTSSLACQLSLVVTDQLGRPSNNTDNQANITVRRRGC